MTATATRPGDSVQVPRTLTAILLTGSALLAVSDGGSAGVRPTLLAAGLGLLWCVVVSGYLVARRWQEHRGLILLQISVELVAVGAVVASTPAVPGLSVFFLGPVALAAVRLGREGATAAAALAALVLLLPALLRGGAPGPVPAATALGAVLLLTAGLVAGELVRLADRRRHAELAAVQQSRRYGREMQMILDNLGSGLLTIDLAGCVTRLNPQARNLLGLSDRVCNLLPVGEVLGPDGEELARLLLAVLTDGKPRRRCEVTVRRHGAALPLGLNVGVLAEEDGSLAGVVAVFTDLTEVRRLQAQLRRADRLAGVGELAASIAHELRNPLASIRGSVEMLAADLEVDGHHAQLMQLILRESARLNTIITDFLAFARMRPAQPREVNLEEFLDQVVLQLRQHIAAQQGRVTVRSENLAPGLCLHADAEQLVQAILNLGLNACEAMQYDGELRLQAAVHDGCCELKVCDTGPGLDPARIEEYFTPFVTTKNHGTGLGLPMVARILNAHGGAVEAGNNPAGGAEFVLRLPLVTTQTRAERDGAPVAEELQTAVC